MGGGYVCERKKYKFQQFVLQLRRCVIIFLFIYYRIKVKRTYTSFHAVSKTISTGHLVVINLSQWFLFCPLFSHIGNYKNFFVSCLPFSYMSLLFFFFITLSPPLPFISIDERMPKIKSQRSVSDSSNNWSEAIGHNSTIRRCRSRRGQLAWRQGLANFSLAEPHVGELNETQEFNICFISQFLLVLFLLLLFCLFQRFIMFAVLWECVIYTSNIVLWCGTYLWRSTSALFNFFWANFSSF